MDVRMTVLGGVAAVTAMLAGRTASAAGDDFEMRSATAMPQAIASFGAATSGEWLYVYGGHIGRAHAHSKDNVIGTFARWNLESGGSFEELPPGPALQGLALVAHHGLVYRLGGLSARNEAGAPDDLHSLAECARFDPATRSWQVLPPLPAGRSSHDAVVIGDKVYVVGGWRLEGAADGEWYHSMCVLDLAQPEPRWEEAPAPFARRALAAATVDGKLLVLGGMNESGDTVNEVDVYDPAKGTWSKGQPFPGEGFGVAAASADSAVF